LVLWFDVRRSATFASTQNGASGRAKILADWWRSQEESKSITSSVQRHHLFPHSVLALHVARREYSLPRKIHIHRLSLNMGREKNVENRGLMVRARST